MKYLITLILILTITIPSYASTLFNSTRLEIVPTATDAVSGVAFVSLSGDSVTWGDNIPYPALVTDWTWVEGVNTVYARFTDAAGNVSSAISAQITIDSLPPEGGSITIRIINSITVE